MFCRREPRRICGDMALPPAPCLRCTYLQDEVDTIAVKLQIWPRKSALKAVHGAVAIILPPLHLPMAIGACTIDLAG
jgi:hypothetical protein